MKTHGKFFRNPAPFVATLINKAKKMKKRKKNPALSVRSAIVTRSAKKNHHKYGDYHYNKAKKLRRAKSAPSTSVPVVSKTKTKMKYKRSRKNRVRPSKRGRRSYSNPMPKSRRGGKRRMLRKRNPSAFREIAGMDNLAVGAGALAGVAGTKLVISMLLAKKVPLTGITYPPAGATWTPAQFTAQNKMVLAIYEAALPALGWYLLRGQAPRFARGLMISVPVNVGLAALKETSIGSTAMPMNAFLRTYIPGVPPILSGPGTAFINNGAPTARFRRNGMGAAVDRSWAMKTTANGADPLAAT